MQDGRGCEKRIEEEKESQLCIDGEEWRIGMVQQRGADQFAAKKRFAHTISNNALRSFSVYNTCQMGVQNPVFFVVLPVNLGEMRLEIVHNVFVIVRTVSI